MDCAFVDTGAWFGYADRRSPEHALLRRSLHAFEGRLITSNYVFAETVTLCLARRGHHAATQVGMSLLRPEVVTMVRLSAEDERAAWELFLRRRDQEYSFTDCTSFVLMRRLGLTRAVALDDDFRREGFEVLGMRSRI